MNPSRSKTAALLLCLSGASLLWAKGLEKEKAESGERFGEKRRAGLASEPAPVVARPTGAPGARAEPRKQAPAPRVPDLKTGTFDDISRLNPTPVDSVRLPKTEEDIRQALAYARSKGLRVSMAGARHSQGGQILYDNNVVLDMDLFKGMTLDRENKVLTVQSGARWDAIQRFLDGQGLSLDVVQTHSKFSVGGSISVNAHGSNPNSGPVSSNVKSMRIMLADGSVVTASRTENADLFRSVVGGYGLSGVILDVQIQLRDNELYAAEGDMVDVAEYPAYFEKNIKDNPRVRYVHALLSTAPSSFLRKVAVVKYVEADASSSELPGMDSPRIHDLKAKIFQRMFFLAKSKPGQELFWLLSGRLAPALASFMKYSRNQAMAEPLIAFKSNDPNETQILNEYFLPPDRFPAFVERLREAVLKYDATLTMAAARGIAADKDAMMPYAPEDRMGLVLFFNQRISPEANEKTAAMTRELIAAAESLGGRFYLPYQLVYSPEQLRAVYPESEQFFKTKRKYDPAELFMNKFYAKYGRAGRGN